MDEDEKDVQALTAYDLTVVAKFIEAFNNGYSVTEACHYAGVSRSTYYNWLEYQPGFKGKMEEAKLLLNRKAKELITKAILADDVGTARWHLERRDPEYRAKGELDLNHGLQETRDKIKGFLEEEDAYNDPADAGSTEPSTEDAESAGEEVAQPTPDIS